MEENGIRLSKESSVLASLLLKSMRSLRVEEKVMPKW